MCTGSKKLEETGLLVQETGHVVATLHWKRVEDVIPGPRPAAIRLSARRLSNGSRLVLDLILPPLPFGAIWAFVFPVVDGGSLHDCQTLPTSPPTVSLSSGRTVLSLDQTTFERTLSHPRVRCTTRWLTYCAESREVADTRASQPRFAVCAELKHTNRRCSMGQRHKD